MKTSSRLVLRAGAGLLAATTALLFAFGCSSSSSSGDCCLISIEGTTSCYCGSGSANGTSYVVTTDGSTCALTATVDGTMESVSGKTVSTCEGQPMACSTDSSSTSTGCNNSYTCADGKTYVLECTGTACKCEVDGVTQKTVTGTCSDADAQSLCGFNVD